MYGNQQIIQNVKTHSDREYYVCDCLEEVMLKKNVLNKEQIINKIKYCLEILH